MPASQRLPVYAPARFEHLRGSERIRYGHVRAANEGEAPGECCWTAIRASMSAVERSSSTIGIVAVSLARLEG